ncbi:unnamed protein product, partial [Iphiclides podalirius]
MNVIRCALSIFLIHSCQTKDCVIDNRAPKTAWETQLRKDLIGCSDRHEPPDVNNTQVALKFILKSFYFGSKEENFYINTWLRLSWNDPRLVWDPAKYDGIAEVLLPSMLIWTPILRLYSASRLAGFEDIELYVSQCRISNAGRVECIPRVLHHSVCSTRLKDWPYDTQNCTFEFGTRSKKDRVTFTFNSSRTVLLGAEYGPGWNIIEHTKREDPNASRFYLNFMLERQGEGLAAIIVVPPLVLTLLTLMCMALNFDDGTRLGLLCFSLLNQFFFLQEISSDIPNSGADTPTVLLYLRTSIILTLIAIGITFLLRYLRRKCSPPSNIILMTTEKIIDSYGKYLVWPKWEANLKYHPLQGMGPKGYIVFQMNA